MVLLRKSRTALLILTGLVVSACTDVDNMNHWDTVTLGAGNAMDANNDIQEVTPWPPHGNNTNVQQ